MRPVLLLGWRYIQAGLGRFLLTALAVTASACMVVWVVSGYDALLSSFDKFSVESLGRYPLSIAPISTYRQYAPGSFPASVEKFVPRKAIDDLKADASVVDVDPVWARRVLIRSAGGAPAAGSILPGSGGPSTGGSQRGSGPGGGLRGGGPGGGGPPGGAGGSQGLIGPARSGTPHEMMLATDSHECPFPIKTGRWLGAPGSATANEVVLTAALAGRMGLAVGDEVNVGTRNHLHFLRVVGLMDSPAIAGVGSIPASQILSPSAGSIFVRNKTAEIILAEPARISFAGVAIRPGLDVNDFRFRWSPRLGRYPTPVQFQEAHVIEEALDDSASADNVRVQAYEVTGVAMLTALFLIFSTLNMGVSERIRQYAMLRTIGFARSQVAALITVEALVLATIGFAAGIVVGRALLWFMAGHAPDLIAEGGRMGRNSILLAAVCAYGGALLAAIVPAWRAMRVRPLDAMAPRVVEKSGRSPLAAIILGLPLVAVNPVLSFWVPIHEDSPLLVLIILGCTSMAAGFILLAPAAVRFMDRFASPWVARMMGLPPVLLGSQLSSNLWRSVGTAVALTIGLGLYISIQVWGSTMLSSFIPGPWAPDALVSFNPNGIDPAQAATMANVPGVDPRHCLPLVVEQPRMRDDLTNSAERASVTRQDSLVIIGIDPDAAFGGDDPLMKFEWLEGTPAQAVTMMKEGHGCIVPDHFAREAKLKLGESFHLVPPEDPSHPVVYRIAGIVRMPGWHWQTKTTGFRMRTHRAAALVLAGYADVSKDFSLNTASHVWFDFDAARTDATQLGTAAASLYEKVIGRPVRVGDAPGGDPFVRAMPIEGIRAIVQGHARQWIFAMSLLPLTCLGITTIGVVNAVMASVRARRWDFGVLRAVGFTRWTLVRLVLAEGVLIGLAACALSVGFGVVAGWCGVGISQYVSFFGGLHPVLVVPWATVGIGVLSVVVLTILAAIWPAVSIGRTQPLTLLQQGRGAF